MAILIRPEPNPGTWKATMLSSMKGYLMFILRPIASAHLFGQEFETMEEAELALARMAFWEGHGVWASYGIFTK